MRVPLIFGLLALPACFSGDVIRRSHFGESTEQTPEDEPTPPPGCAPSFELCNGLDDDCDGDIDEGFVLGAACVVDAPGQCLIGVTACSRDGQGTSCADVTASLPRNVCQAPVERCDCDAQTPPATNITLGSSGQGLSPTVAFTGADYALAWREARDGVPAEIRVVQVTSDGEVVSGSEHALDTGASDVREPSATWAGDTTVVAWTHVATAAGPGAVWWQRVAADGMVRDGAPFVASANVGAPGTSHRSPAAAWDRESGALAIAWVCDGCDCDGDGIGETSTVQLGIGAADGATPLDVRCLSASPLLFPSLSLAARSGLFAVAAAHGGQLLQLFMIAADWSGHPDNEAKKNINSQRDMPADAPAIAAGPAGFALAWRRLLSSTPLRSEDQVRLFTYDAALPTARFSFGPNTSVATATTGSQGPPSITFEGDEARIAWAEEREDESDLRFARVAADGTYVADSERHLSLAAGVSTAPILRVADGALAVAWEDEQATGAGRREIFFSRFVCAP